MHRYRPLYLLILFAPLTARADMALALRALEQGNHVAAYHELSHLALAGNPAAQYNLGFLYFQGTGVRQDERKAFYWFNHSARSEYAHAQDVLGYLYNHGLGVERDRMRAYVWYTVAAANGIFLAESIKEKLARTLKASERIQADLMVEDYLKHYQSETND